MYRRLNPHKILSTIRLVRGRVQKLFPQSGLGEVSSEVLAAAEDVLEEGRKLRRPLWKLRCLIAASTLLLIAIPILVGMSLKFDTAFDSLADFMQATDAGFNVLILLTGGIIFLISTENRVKRNRTLRSLNQLRSLAHVIDMHQLSKDPGMLRIADLEPRGDRIRPPCIRSDEHLWYYLSFCCDLLAVLGKLAAWYAEFQTDRAVLQTVNGIENLCSDTARKVWQKMSFLAVPAAAPGLAGDGAAATSKSAEMPPRPEVPAA